MSISMSLVNHLNAQVCKRNVCLFLVVITLVLLCFSYAVNNMIKDQMSMNIQEMGDKMFAHLSKYNDQLSKEIKDKNNVMLVQLVSISEQLSSKNHPMIGEDQQTTCGDCIKSNDDMVAHVPVRELLDFDIAVYQNDATAWLQYLLKCK